MTDLVHHIDHPPLHEPTLLLALEGWIDAGAAAAGAIRSILGVTASLDGADLGALGPLSPPVRFGFSSAPATPAIVDVTTTIVLPRGGETAPRRDEEKGAAS